MSNTTIEVVSSKKPPKDTVNLFTLHPMEAFYSQGIYYLMLHPPGPADYASVWNTATCNTQAMDNRNVYRVAAHVEIQQLSR